MTIQSMRSDRFNPGALFLLMIFSFQAITAGWGSQFLLCLGCDETGFAIGIRQTDLLPTSIDGCCSSIVDEMRNDLSIEERSRVSDPNSVCDCVGVELQRFNTSYTTLVNAHDVPLQNTVIESSPESWEMIALSDSVCPRGPPGTNTGHAGRTLFGLRTLLTV